MLYTNQITKVEKNFYFVHYGLILDFGGRTLFFGVIYILVLVSEILVEEIQNSRENLYIDQQYEKFRKKNSLVEVIEILVPEQYIPSRAFILSFNIFLFPSDSGYLNKNK
jgi:hypothetical protein